MECSTLFGLNWSLHQVEPSLEELDRPDQQMLYFCLCQRENKRGRMSKECVRLYIFHGLNIFFCIL
jgi:hypothetical protein